MGTKLSGKTVGEVRGKFCFTDESGRKRSYGYVDLRYDVNCGRLKVGTCQLEGQKTTTPPRKLKCKQQTPASSQKKLAGRAAAPLPSKTTGAKCKSIAAKKKQ